MAIEFLSRIFGVQPVKRDVSLTPQNRGKKKQGEGEQGSKKEGRKEENKAGKIDIKI